MNPELNRKLFKHLQESNKTCGELADFLHWASSELFIALDKDDFPAWEKLHKVNAALKKYYNDQRIKSEKLIKYILSPEFDEN